MLFVINMEEIVSALILIGIIWLTASSFFNHYNLKKVKNGLWRISEKFPDNFWRGRIVRITGIWRNNFYIESADNNGDETNLSNRHLKYLTRVKELSEGGEKKVKRMPRIFRFALYLALVVLVWDVVFNINSIVNFLLQTFLLHK